MAARPWEAFVYAVASVLVPQLMTSSPVFDFCSAMARPLPTPGGGPAAAVASCTGIALLEMSAEISARKKGWAVELKSFAQLRAKGLELAQSDGHAYCGLLSCIYEGDDVRDNGKLERWTQLAAETPYAVIELCYDAVQHALTIDRRQLIKSVRGDWEAGVEHLAKAVSISSHNVAVNVSGASWAWARDMEEKCSSRTVATFAGCDALKTW
eukprot:TRINITY_DN75745_c0_g1_i1.p1 TRINITY_DN75745_c0_g1~~TRINITY_DN75745_c0_g1_i1.p1  ORF type:complete len:247 (-),score=39.99 TRINITY_DN75745_c0_g1_i1:316-948(-)